MAKKQKYYVVWQGKQPGIYTDWDECKEQVVGVQGAQYKGFDSLAEAEAAIKLPYGSVVAQSTQNNQSNPNNQNTQSTQNNPSHRSTRNNPILFVDNDGMTALRPDAQPPLPVLDALAVDAACSGNPGVMEYQGIYIPTRTQVFHYRAERGTNNIGEFLAIVHGLSYLKKHRLNQIIYSDSVNAISWVRQKVCKSKLPNDARTAELWDFVHRAEQWLRTNTYTTEIRKWDTDRWGEIPADFGRKG
ncbi:MAG: ribonuclease H family protein [Bacteroidales bacterium]|nr:ribonuclease H family protein [Bacteroidales bacterium]